MNNFKEKIKELRINKGLTQEQLGKQFGFTKMTVCRWELGEREPDYDTLIEISKFFGETVGYLLGTED